MSPGHFTGHCSWLCGDSDRLRVCDRRGYWARMAAAFPAEVVNIYEGAILLLISFKALLLDFVGLSLDFD